MGSCLLTCLVMHLGLFGSYPIGLLYRREGLPPDSTVVHTLTSQDSLRGAAASCPQSPGWGKALASPWQGLLKFPGNPWASSLIERDHLLEAAVKTPLTGLRACCGLQQGSSHRAQMAVTA